MSEVRGGIAAGRDWRADDVLVREVPRAKASLKNQLGGSLALPVETTDGALLYIQLEGGGGNALAVL